MNCRDGIGGDDRIDRSVTSSIEMSKKKNNLFESDENRDEGEKT